MYFSITIIKLFSIYIKKCNTNELIDWVNLLSTFFMDHRNKIRYTILEIAIIFGLEYQINNKTKKLIYECISIPLFVLQIQ